MIFATVRSKKKKKKFESANDFGMQPKYDRVYESRARLGDAEQE